MPSRKRICAAPGCPEVLTADEPRGRCLKHRREKERGRGTRTQRGYGKEHTNLRARWKRRMLYEGEQVVCWRCLEEQGIKHFVDPEAFDLGHDDHDRSIIRGPECRRGNRAAPRRRENT